LPVFKSKNYTQINARQPRPAIHPNQLHYSTCPGYIIHKGVRYKIHAASQPKTGNTLFILSQAEFDAVSMRHV